MRCFKSLSQDWGTFWRSVWDSVITFSNWGSLPCVGYGPGWKANARHHVSTGSRNAAIVRDGACLSTSVDSAQLDLSKVQSHVESSILFATGCNISATEPVICFSAHFYPLKEISIFTPSASGKCMRHRDHLPVVGYQVHFRRKRYPNIE